MNHVSGPVMGTLPLQQFRSGFLKHLPGLIKLLKSDVIRQHERWGRLLPYDVPVYGNQPSPGHCVRPDIVMTDQGPIICEIDFVSSGRAHLIESLRAFPDARQQVLKGFADWYQAMGTSSVLYGTGTRTSCFRETELFCTAMQEEVGFDITAVNLDEYPDLSGRFIDRLTYASEMVTRDPDRQYLRHATVTTAEPFLDCKAFAALLHDRGMHNLLEQQLGRKALQFWQKHVPWSVLESELTEQSRQVMSAHPQAWVIKSTDVETDACWGCRGTVVGSAYRSTIMRGYFLKGNQRFGQKDPGPNPMIQALRPSVDLSEFWNLAVAGQAAQPDPVVFAREVSDVCRQPATQQVHGRIGFFVPVTATGQVIRSVSEYAEIVLRQSAIVHGASDALTVAVKIV